MASNQIFFEDAGVGTSVTPLVKHPTNAQLFRFSAVTWNSHLIHYDKVYAQSEGYPDVLVQSHLHGCFLLQTVMDWAGQRSRVLGFRWQNRGIATPGDVLTCSGKVVKAEAGVIECELEERNQKGEVCAPGWARIELPRRG